MKQENEELFKKLFLELKTENLALYPTGIFQGDDDEIRICIYPFAPHYLEFTIEDDNTITVVHEIDDIEDEYKDNLSFEECVELISKYKLELYQAGLLVNC